MAPQWSSMGPLWSPNGPPMAPQRSMAPPMPPQWSPKISERPIQKKSLSANTDNQPILPIISANISAEIEARFGEKSSKIVHKLGMLFLHFFIRVTIIEKAIFLYMLFNLIKKNWPKLLKNHYFLTNFTMF